MGGVRKWQFSLIYSTIYADVGGWVGLKSQKHADVILECSLILNVGSVEWPERDWTKCQIQLGRQSLVDGNDL